MNTLVQVRKYQKEAYKSLCSLEKKRKLSRIQKILSNIRLNSIHI